jgi:hypothetical protein
MAKRHLRLVAPAAVNRTVTPKRAPNADLRTREYLTKAEVEWLMNAAKGNCWGYRDATMILVAYRHGLRASELVDLPWGPDRVREGLPARPQGQAGHPEHASESSATNYALCGGCSASRSPSRPMCSLRSAGDRSAPPASLAWSSGRAGRPSWPSRRTRTCCGTPAGTRWLTKGTIRGRYRRISATATSSTQCAIQSCRRHA